MPTDTTVKFFTSAMSGAPTHTNAVGSIIALLDACLVNGFGSVTLDSLVIADNVATGTVSTGHGFAMTGATGPVIRIAGATPSGLNGDWRIQTVPNSTTFTFTTSGISNQTATGTITAKRAPAGFEKAFSGTGKAAYRSASVASTRGYLLVLDTDVATPASWNQLQQFESMSDVDTGTGGSTVYYSLKYATSSGHWMLVADDRAFYFIARTFNSNESIGQFFFGDLAYPAQPADAYHCGLIGLQSAATNNSYGLARFGDSGESGRLMRSYDQVTANVALRRYGHALNSGALSNGGGSYLSALGVAVTPVQGWESGTTYRGDLPGLYSQVHANLWTWNQDYYEHAVLGTLYGYAIYNDGWYHAFFNLTGPWR